MKSGSFGQPRSMNKPKIAARPTAQGDRDCWRRHLSCLVEPIPTLVTLNWHLVKSFE